MSNCPFCLQIRSSDRGEEDEERKPLALNQDLLSKCTRRKKTDKTTLLNKGTEASKTTENVGGGKGVGGGGGGGRGGGGSRSDTSGFVSDSQSGSTDSDLSSVKKKPNKKAISTKPKTSIILEACAAGNKTVAGAETREREGSGWLIIGPTFFVTT